LPLAGQNFRVDVGKKSKKAATISMHLRFNPAPNVYAPLDAVRPPPFPLHFLSFVFVVDVPCNSSPIHAASSRADRLQLLLDQRLTLLNHVIQLGSEGTSEVASALNFYYIYNMRGDELLRAAIVRELHSVGTSLQYAARAHTLTASL
jgi:hypothetical protein